MITNQAPQRTIDLAIAAANERRYMCLICGEHVVNCAADGHAPQVSFEAFVHVLAKNGTADFKKADLFQIRHIATALGIDMRDTIDIALSDVNS